MYTFKKNERLGNHRLQSLLFEQGNAFFQYPFRIQYLFLTKKINEDHLSIEKQHPPGAVFHFPAKCLVSVSKRQLKKAVQRNKVKRLVREAYRKNKNTFYTFLERERYNGVVAFVYTADRILSYNEIEEAVNKSVKKLEAMLEAAQKDNESEN